MPIIHEVSDCVIFMWGNTAKLYLNMSMQHWTKVGGGKRPQPRHSHTACCIAGPLTGEEHSVLMVVGGWDRLKVFSDVWLLDVDKGVWSEVGMLYLIALPVIYKHADSCSKLCLHP